MPVQTTPFSGPHYGSRAGIEAWYGSVNVSDYFDVNSVGATLGAADIAANIEYGLSTFDNLVARRFREGVKFNGVNIPVTVPLFGDAFYDSLAPIADEWTGAWGYFKRGKFDSNGKPDGAMQYHLDHAEAELAMLIQSIYSHALTPANTFQFIEIEGDEETADENSWCV
jgi:hypothetical protein